MLIYKREDKEFGIDWQSGSTGKQEALSLSPSTEKKKKKEKKERERIWNRRAKNQDKFMICGSRAQIKFSLLWCT
jgi:hypothetical protein